MFRIPYFYPQKFNPGTQITNFGAGGPQSHMEIIPSYGRTYPTVYAVGLYGMTGAMPRQVLGPTAPVTVNQYAGIKNTMIINGLSKGVLG